MVELVSYVTCVGFIIKIVLNGWLVMCRCIVPKCHLIGELKLINKGSVLDQNSEK